MLLVSNQFAFFIICISFIIIKYVNFKFIGDKEISSYFVVSLFLLFLFFLFLFNFLTVYLETCDYVGVGDFYANGQIVNYWGQRNSNFQMREYSLDANCASKQYLHLNVSIFHQKKNVGLL